MPSALPCGSGSASALTLDPGDTGRRDRVDVGGDQQLGRRSQHICGEHLDARPGRGQRNLAAGKNPPLGGVGGRVFGGHLDGEAASSSRQRWRPPLPRRHGRPASPPRPPWRRSRRCRNRPRPVAPNTAMRVPASVRLEMPGQGLLDLGHHRRTGGEGAGRVGEHRDLERRHHRLLGRLEHVERQAGILAGDEDPVSTPASGGREKIASWTSPVTSPSATPV